MAGVDDQLVCEESQRELLRDEKAARSVVISNISAEIGKDEVMIYFQKTKIGGGEVDAVSMIEDGKAVVVFEKPEVAERVMKRRHVLRGKKLELGPYCPNQEENPEVFSQVIALVNFNMFQLSSQESHNLLEKVRNKVGIKWRKEADGFTLSGMFDQVENAHQLLQEHFSRRPYLQISQEKEQRRKHTGRTQQNAPHPSKQASKDVKITNICTFEVQPKFMKLLKRAYNTKLQKTEMEFSLEIAWVENARQVRIQPRQTTQESLYQKGCDEFIALYQKVYQDVKREVLEIENAGDEEGILNAIQTVEAENPVVIEKFEKQLFVYAEENCIKSAVQSLRQQLELLQIKNQSARRSQSNINHGAFNFNENLQQDRLSFPNLLQHTLRNGVNIALCQGDITDEKVDAIVNATNAWLQHGKDGVAAAIVRKGGAQIVEESRYIMSQRRNAPLQVSEAVYTRSGNLASQFVIHTVGPDYKVCGKERSIALLRRACLESLRVAVRLGLRSVALPAISSGRFDMPKDVCAGAIFKAVEEYSLSVDAECSHLRDVRIVIIDGPTIEVFREEFVRRYYSNEMSEKQMTHHAQANEERENAFASNLSRDSRIAKNQLSSVPNNQENNVDHKSSGVEMDKSQHSNNVESATRRHPPQLPNENDKTTLATSVETPADERYEVDIQKEENPVPDIRSAKTAKSSGARATAGRSNFAPSFRQKDNGNSRKSKTAGKGMKSKQMETPLGTSAKNSCEENRMQPENHDQYTDAGDSVTKKEETKPRSVALENADQPNNESNDESASEDMIKEKSVEETANEEKALVTSPSNQAQVDKITQSDNIKKADSPDPPTGASSGSVEWNDTSDSNLNTPKTRDTELQTSTDNTPAEESAADSVNTKPNIPALAPDANLIPPQKTTEERDPDISPTESDAADANTDPSQFGDTSQSSDQPIQSHCSICRDTFRDPVHPSKCGHTFCKSCVDKALADGTAVVMCNQEWCAYERNQPIGVMSWRTEKEPLTGYEDCETIAVTYNFAEGQQGWRHPRPGQPYDRLYFTAYLPSNPEGQAVCKLLERAFDASLLFTVGRSSITGKENQILSNGVDHKTNRLGGPSNHGYPDPDYLDRVRTQLENKGILDEETVI